MYRLPPITPLVEFVFSAQQTASQKQNRKNVEREGHERALEALGWYEHAPRCASFELRGVDGEERTRRREIQIQTPLLRPAAANALLIRRANDAFNGASNFPWMEGSLVRSLVLPEMMQASLVEAMQQGLQNLVGTSSGA